MLIIRKNSKGGQKLKSFTVQFHSEDQLSDIHVQKLNEDDFNRVTEVGTRHLFELDTNLGLFVFFDAEDESGKLHYLVLQYEEDHENPSACYSFELKDFYQFMALYLNDLEFAEEEENNRESDEEVYGPIHHLAHLMFHVVEEGKDLVV